MRYTPEQLRQMAQQALERRGERHPSGRGLWSILVVRLMLRTGLSREHVTAQIINMAH